jgi:hypothetical protein
MMINKFITNTLFTIRLTARFAYQKPFYRNFNGKGKVVKREEEEVPQPPKISMDKAKSMEVYESQADVELADSLAELNLKDFSIKIHHLLVGR